MKILIDMNLPPAWAEALQRAGFQAVHWSEVGDIRATDAVIMAWARDHGYIVFTHDLDFGAILATTRAESPSVIQVRTQDIMPQSLGERLVRLLHQQESLLEQGALVTVDEAKSRIHVLPFN
ncbi:hypothetical protein GW866_05230 [bacterium]|nr:hypothetical protein [bacterium]OIO88181.1 MAG: hypothetical protein AUK02_04110 [Anaerolineae bacterium CG2_30_58_95]PIW19118.1 MAG: hypothetical protein COW33_05215 [Anaerolineae bacterium CG17_big_fil_post_rev_8_21_14_2_50_57_27]PJH74464.1 MAG: hypothetical protein CO064_11895 [Anaerolineae bacterium CG_4_9_14_0_8_um_filter_58_9]